MGYLLMVSVLFLIVSFGFGVTINMVFRRWWASLVLFVVLSVYLWIHIAGHWSTGIRMAYGISVVGVLLCTWAVRALRKRGYALFS